MTNETSHTSDKKRIWRKALLAASCCLLLVAIIIHVLNSYRIKHFNVNMVFEPVPGGVLAQFPLGEECTLVSVSGFPVDFDMGSRHSFMSEKSLVKIKKDGYPIEIKPTLVYTTDEHGQYRLYTHKVCLDLILPNPNVEGGKYFIRNAELLVNDRSDRNIFGMDVLRNFVIERLYTTNELIIYQTLPALKDYLLLSDITLHNSLLGDVFGEVGRASVSLRVNNDDKREYFFDTSGEMRNIEIVQPKDRMNSALTKVTYDSIIGHHVQRHCKVKFGDRLRYSTVVYSNDIHTDEYSVNPLKLFDSDVIFDFPGRQLLIRRVDSIPGTQPTEIPQS